MTCDPEVHTMATTTLTDAALHRIQHRDHFRRCAHVFTLLKQIAAGGDRGHELSEADIHEHMLDAATGFGRTEWKALDADDDIAERILIALRALVDADSPIPKAITDYFGPGVIPAAFETYSSGAFERLPAEQLATVAYARSLRRRGVKRLAVRVGDRVADFAIEELT
jgi:hypothetical protein